MRRADLGRGGQAALVAEGRGQYGGTEGQSGAELGVFAMWRGRLWLNGDLAGFANEAKAGREPPQYGLHLGEAGRPVLRNRFHSFR